MINQASPPALDIWLTFAVDYLRGEYTLTLQGSVYRIAGLFLFMVLAASAQSRISVRILLEATDNRTGRWDGTIQAQGGQIASLEPWRFEGVDAIDGHTWHCSTHAGRLFGAGTNNPFVANGVIVNLTGAAESTELKLTTAQGDFAFRLNDAPYGKTLSRLNGRVLIDRITPSSQITKTPDEEDYPVAAASNGDVWIAYVHFRHNPDHKALRATLLTPMRDFSRLKASPGGDQVIARKYSGGAWGPGIAVTEAGADLYRPAIAIGGQGRSWVFYAQNVGWPSSKPNFEIYGSCIQNGRAGAKIRLSNDPGNDIDPVAATDSTGKVWVAWQGWRNGRAGIFAAAQNGDKFDAATAVSSSPANEWNPAIAADRTGGLQWRGTRIATATTISTREPQPPEHGAMRRR